MPPQADVADVAADVADANADANANANTNTNTTAVTPIDPDGEDTGEALAGTRILRDSCRWEVRVG